MPWSEWPQWLWPCCIAFAVSVLGTRWAIRYAHRQDLLDHPGERRSHHSPTPRGGGIGIVLATLGCCVWLSRMDAFIWGWAATGLALIAIAGWWDDHRNLPVWPRLAMHVLAGGLLAIALYAHSGSWQISALAIVLVPVLVNVWNFMDGIDGLAASQAALCGLALAGATSGSAQGFALVVAATCLGFLPFNLPQANIFLGDVGSGALGYLMALLVLACLPAYPVTLWPLLLMPLGAMLVDAGMTLGCRMWRGERWWQPHVQHLYQRFARRAGHGWVTAAYAGWTALAIGIMLVALRLGEAEGLSAGGVFAVTSLGLWVVLYRKAGGSEGISS